jgi:hypothetical protein
MQKAPPFVEVILDSMLSAHTTGDYDAFCRLSTESFGEKVKREQFEQASLALGQSLSHSSKRRFLGSFRREGRPVYLFALSGETPDHETLVQMCLVGTGNEALVEWMWIE